MMVAHARPSSVKPVDRPWPTAVTLPSRQDTSLTEPLAPRLVSGRPDGRASKRVHEGAPPQPTAQGGAALGLPEARAVTPGWPRSRRPVSGKAVGGTAARILTPTRTRLPTEARRR